MLVHSLMGTSASILLMGMEVSFTFWLLWRMPFWVWVYRYLFLSLLSVILGIYPEVGLLDHMIVLFNFFGWIAIPFSIAAATFYIPTGNIQGFQLLHIFANFCYCLVFFLHFLFVCFNNSHPIVKWHLVVFVCIQVFWRCVCQDERMKHTWFVKRNSL